MFDDQLTPYMHVLINHAPEFAAKYGSLKGFEMEDIEYQNYENKMIFFGASNKMTGKAYTSVQVTNLNFIYKIIYYMYKIYEIHFVCYYISDCKDIESVDGCSKT